VEWVLVIAFGLICGRLRFVEDKVMNKRTKQIRLERPLLIGLLCLLFLTGCGGGDSRWNGTYTGNVTESSQITILQADGTANAFTGGRSQTDVAVTLIEEGNDTAMVTFGDCSLRLTLADENQASVASGQGCDINVNGYTGPVIFTGQVYFDGNGKLLMQLSGLPDRPETTGGYSYVFIQP
jgi:hypothetical protein